MTEIKRQRMIGWYDPRQLLQTAFKVLVSTIFAQHSDHRIIEALFTGTDKIYDFADQLTRDSKGEYVNNQTGWYAKDGECQEIWIDYVSDTGDGWDSTYAVAYWITQPQLNLSDQNGATHPTRRGSILVFGGDEVYPTPDRKEYQQRLVQPYEAALRAAGSPHPFVFAIPGNHDWYDSLVSFTRLFLSKQCFASWIAPQSRSYFALKLPHGWWLLGADVQLGSDIDGQQVEYFQRIANDLMEDDDRIILCIAEPHWVYSEIYRTYDSEVYNESNLQFLEQKVFGSRRAVARQALGKQVSGNPSMRVFIAGDLHQYLHHRSEGGTHKITAGGGGAFLHLTNGHDVSILQPIDTREDRLRDDPEEFRLQKSFPTRSQSWFLCLRNLAFPIQNFRFGLITAVLYVLMAWAVLAPIHDKGIHEWDEALRTAIESSLQTPIGTFLPLAVVSGFILFTDIHSKLWRSLMGGAHGVFHLVAIFLIGWFAAYLCSSPASILSECAWGTCSIGLQFPYKFRSVHQLLLSGGLIFIVGWFIGSFIMGLYLLLSLNIFRLHQNEASSSLMSPDWKNFLRLKIDRQGHLTIFPIGIRRVPRKWKPSGSKGTGPEFIPDDPKSSDPQLIEPPIVVT